MATHSIILAWNIPGTEEPCELQSMGSQRVGHDLMTEQQQGSKLHHRRPFTLAFNSNCLPSLSLLLTCSFSSPQPFWHQGLVL